MWGRWSLVRIRGPPVAKKPSRASSSAQPRPARMPRKAKSGGGAIRRQWMADQLWSHSTDAGEEWLLIRLASNRNTRSSQSHLLRKPSRLVAAAMVSVVVEAASRSPLTAATSCGAFSLSSAAAQPSPSDQAASRASETERDPQAVATSLAGSNDPLGAKLAEFIQEIGPSHCFNLADKMNWNEFGKLILKAKKLGVLKRRPAKKREL